MNAASNCAVQVAAQQTCGPAGRAVGYTALVHGFPLLESYRECAMQINPASAAGFSGPGRVSVQLPINTLQHTHTLPPEATLQTPQDPSTLLRSVAWIHLADGPVLLTLPASVPGAGVELTLSLHDAYTEEIRHCALSDTRPGNETVVLIGPYTVLPESLRAYPAVQCQTQLVRFEACISVVAGADPRAIGRAQQALGVRCALDDVPRQPPAILTRWLGEPLQVMAQALRYEGLMSALAPRLYANLCAAFSESPGCANSQAIMASFKQASIVPCPKVEWRSLDSDLKAGLTSGFANAIMAIAQGWRPTPIPTSETGWALECESHASLSRARASALKFDGRRSLKEPTSAVSS